MDKSTMDNTIRKVFLERISSSDFNIDVAEMAWEELFDEVELTDEQDAEMSKLFDECFMELMEKIVAVLKE